MQPELVERHEREPASVKDGRELSIWPFVTSCGFAPMVLQTVPQCLSFSEERCPGQSVHVVSLGVSTTTWEWGISVSTPVPSNTPLWPWRLHANFLITISCPDITDSPIRYYLFWKAWSDARIASQLVQPIDQPPPASWLYVFPPDKSLPYCMATAHPRKWPRSHLTWSSTQWGILVSLVVWCIQRRP